MVLLCLSFRLIIHREEGGLWSDFSVGILLVDEVGGEQCVRNSEEPLEEFH